MSPTEYLRVGRLVSTHGIRGEVRILPDTDFPEERFAPGSQLLLQHPSLSEPLLLTVEKGRPHKNVWLVKFAEWSNINEAEPYKGGRLVVSIRDAVPVQEDEGEYYFYQIIGCDVFTTDGRHLGQVREILQLPANDVWVVRPKDKGKEILLPYIDDVVKQVDTEEKRITIEWMEGLE
ncbi:16S rRNA processing protein RimM [Thermoflavimicrobium dichotomicum]|uniref:Ribosome maturation factor RimM n=1 Tax=Thermoflavimicrobium dichotomicum TaxID=46223 RepID=A0A1I3UBD1_9BACL|nr:ribosome maturation factor RimM [Thermoflavimicrobium dichotomicum]SFJ80222.1 16S rRNA processing protein RimM [Thermoflavimicrobium dichotomicum]